MDIRPGSIAARRRFGLAVERLETRDLPTAPTLLGGPIGGVSPRSPIAMTSATVADGSPSPTPHELAREAFVAKFSGSYVTGPGRYTDQASQVFIDGGGTSSAFLHGDLQMTFAMPRDPSAQVTGIAALIVKNVSNSGNLLLLDLQGDKQSYDRAGRPTRFTWTVDGSSGGTFTGATGVGTVEIRFRAGGRLPQRATGAGKVSAIFRGSINTTGVTNVLRS